jgi:hypothetical protein
MTMPLLEWSVLAAPAEEAAGLAAAAAAAVLVVVVDDASCGRLAGGRVLFWIQPPQLP